ncbi:MAG TPA: geranylgeranyl hydrogenase, partial [Thermodesulfobacteriota bacterium]|nr:geranylgeranyl hydrogenase [Thermodesulfobacteriota bacterium]
LPGYGWIFPTGESSANVGVGIAARALGKKNLQKLFAGFLSDRHLKERFRSARMVEGSLRAWLIPMGSFGRRRSRGNVLLAGDAGGFADVLTGEGIYHALRGGECAAQAAEQTLGLKTGDGRAGELYEKLWRRIFPPAESWLGSMIQRRVVGEFFLNFHVRRASGKPAMARNLASILCHQKTKMRLLF